MVDWSIYWLLMRFQLRFTHLNFSLFFCIDLLFMTCSLLFERKKSTIVYTVWRHPNIMTGIMRRITSAWTEQGMINDFMFLYECSEPVLFFFSLLPYSEQGTLNTVSLACQITSRGKYELKCILYHGTSAYIDMHFICKIFRNFHESQYTC